MRTIGIEELMVGDWVVYDPNVFEEDEMERWHDLEATRIESPEDINDAESECYYPIDITPELLADNGFIRKGGFHFVSDRKRDATIGWIEGDNTVCVNDVTLPVKVEYIHELQHIMRICGFKDLNNINL